MADGTKVIAEFEREVEAGRYDAILKQGTKFSEGERALMADTELQELWGKVKARYDITKF